MDQLTHEEARRLIQLKADQELDPMSSQSLDAHIAQCNECNAYASDLIELENILQRVTHRKWDKRPALLSIGILIDQVRVKQFGAIGNLLTTRIAAIVVAFVAVLIGAWQFSQTTFSPTPRLLTAPLPIPTPSTQLTGTSLSLLGCEFVLYEVTGDDTLEFIARQFAVSKADIMAFNNLDSETVFTGQKIKIPLCKSTPTGTINPPTTTITVTPQFNLITTTPG